MSKGSACDQQSESIRMEHEGDANLFKLFQDCSGVWEDKIKKKHTHTQKKREKEGEKNPQKWTTVNLQYEEVVYKTKYTFL